MESSQGQDKHEEPGEAENILELLENMKQEIWTRRPILGNIMKKHGEDSLHRYAQDFMDVNNITHLDTRKPELIDTATELVRARLGDDVAMRVGKQLAKLPLVSTTDHHGPITHPFFVNSNIISAIPYFGSQDTDLNSLVVFSFASVSTNNASAYPRGILFHGGADGSGNLIRLPILPDKLKMGVVYGMRPFTREDLTKAEAELYKKEKAGEIASGRADQVRNLLEKFFARPDVLSASDLASQISIINYHLWPTLFHTAETDGLSAAPGTVTNGGRQTIPDLLYLEIETLVTELLLRHHLPKTDTLIYRLLFEPTFRTLSAQHFNNIPGAFSIEKQWGTHMFWAVDEKLHRVRLILQDGKLISDDGLFIYDFTPDSIAQLLKEKKIFPSMLLCYVMVSLYYGMKCLGGFSQVNDLTRTKEAWQEILRAVDETTEADAIMAVQTKELGGDGMVLAYHRTGELDMVPATGIDMALKKSDTTFAKYVARSKELTMSEIMQPMIPEMYTVLYPIQDRKPEYNAVTPEKILRKTSLLQKLTAGQ
ncbi:MAG: hypothetical protein KBD73_01430 [Candidatus Magasanikbacteria bacterium]|nr:hypothetical protein [Candidatus Magasanikbacteria bacterium]